MSWFSSPLQVTWGKSSYPLKLNEIQLLQNQDQWRYLRKLIPTNCSGSQGVTHMWPWSLLTGKQPCFLTRSIWKLTFSIFFLSIGECLITRVLPLVSKSQGQPWALTVLIASKEEEDCGEWKERIHEVKFSNTAYKCNKKVNQVLPLCLSYLGPREAEVLFGESH